VASISPIVLSHRTPKTDHVARQAWAYKVLLDRTRSCVLLLAGVQCINKCLMVAAS